MEIVMTLKTTFKRVLPVLCLSLAGAACLLAQTDITGFWVYRVPTGDGNYLQSFFDLKQEGTAVTGKMVGQREMAIADGSFADGKLHFTITRTFRQQSRTTTYDGTLENGKFELTMRAGNREPEKGEMERSTPEAAAPPPRLPIPALHDIPDNGLARTPPMGWNSWNLFARRIDDKTVREMADAMITSGMKEAGYIYINIDDTWQGAQRDANGNITGNLKFPDMKALADYVHSKGLKIGIYSSPGPTTCAGYMGSYGHEEQDAKTFAAWGIDYLKYDWCGAARIYKDEDMQAVYQKMGDALQRTGRPIVYSLCQYGRDDVWKWGAKVGGNSWRTTDDIKDRWESMEAIGFSQPAISSYISVGHWNDPDMLEIGNGGMTTDEYRTHMSLWSMLAAPLLAGNDLRNMTEETKSILMNKEVIAIDQDPAAHPVKVVSQEGTAEVLARPLHDNSLVVGLYNRGDQPAELSVSWESLGLAGKKLRARDLWKHQDITAGGDSFSATVPTHGVVLLRVSAQ